ncbi:MAG: glycosyltransferase family 4 protein [Hyphomicrobiales bacterium]|nr:glycosyltransferase family 4 protein [Hyphomicrobiales bacterium]OQW83968.1 MAG: hypothetical protein BVN31_04465 [Proteobacteria bacterium ST_bin15]
MSAFHLFLLMASSFILSWGMTWVMIALLERSGRLDHPNERSSHIIPTPRGAGLAIIVVFVMAMSMIITTGGARDPVMLALLVAVLMLAFVSWIDDRRPLPWRVRLSVQSVAVAGTLGMFAAGSTLPLALPVPLLFILVPFVVLGWLWVTNLTNFMDGIDGIVGVEMIAFATGSALCLHLVGAAPELVALLLALAAASAGFLWWNWPPAKIFLGDVGSIPLGFLIGFFMLVLVSHGLWGAALALPATFLTDATLTLFLRFRRGERLTQAHRHHFYQRAAGLERAHHLAVILRVLAADAALIIAALIGVWMKGWTGQAVTVALAAIIAILFLAGLQRLAHLRTP